MDIRVASIIDLGEIVINKGLKDDILEQMEFLVYEIGNEIIDPITKESLGKLEIPKGKFRVSHIQDRMTVLLSNYRPNSNLFGMQTFGKLDTELEKLRNINVGDKVKIVNESKFIMG